MSREEIREVVRGVRRQVELLEESGFVAPLGCRPPASTRDLASDAAPAPVPAMPRPLPLPSHPDDETRRSIPSARGEVVRSPDEKERALAAIAKKVGSCNLCGLCEHRTLTVPGEGSARARVLFVGEGPGAMEDQTGRPFVGKAGQLLTRIIENGMRFKRSEVFIANIVKCRPPGNRDPLPEEVAACLPYLYKQIEVLDPEVIIPLGRHSMRELARVGERETISRVRGKVYRVNGRAVIPTFHPAYLLRNPPEKEKVWFDIQLAMKELGIPIQRTPTNGATLPVPTDPYPRPPHAG